MLNIKGKSIFLFGYYGRGNIGDDIMLNNLLRIFMAKGVSQITLLVGNNYSPMVEDNRIVVLTGIKKHLFRFFKSLVKSDYFMWGGGTCFFDNKSKRGLKDLILFLQLRKIFNKTRNYFIGIGVEPVKDSKPDIAKILKCTRGIVVRDSESFENLKAIDSDIVCKLDFCEVYDDLVFFEDTKYLIQDSYKSVDFSASSKYITFSGHFNYGQEMAMHVAKQLIALMAKFDKGYNIVFLPAKFKVPSDSCFHDKVIEELSKLNFNNYRQFDIKNINDFVSILSNADYHIGMRLHSIILSDIVGVANIALAYQNKIYQYAPHALDPATEWATADFKKADPGKINLRIKANTANYEKFFN